MPSPSLSHEVVEQNKELIKLKADISGSEVNFERHRDWLTTAYWTLAKGYNLGDFLKVVERVFEEAEADGYELEEHEIVLFSPDFDDIEEATFRRPLEPKDLEALGAAAGRPVFFRLGDDLARFTYDSSSRQVVTLFDEKPRQTKSAFRFMAELLTKDGALEPREIGKFVLGLPRPS